MFLILFFVLMELNSSFQVFSMGFSYSHPQQKKWEKPGCPSPLIAKSKVPKFNQTQMTT